MSGEAGSATGSTVAVLGLGLIGGSVARDLAARGTRVIAYDRDASALRSAREAGVVRGEIDAGLHEVSEADIIVIATPVDEAHGVLQRIAKLGPGARLLMDVGSTKTGVLATATAHGLGDRFVGSHPLTGDHMSGWRASRTGLFTGARVFVCPAPQATAAALALALAFWKSLGAIPECIEARVHDERLAWSSHLPHLVSSALGLALRGAGIGRAELGPGGRDMTRLAGSSADVWAPIVRENATAIAAALAAAEDELRTLRQLLQVPDSAELAARLSEARAWFDAPAADTVTKPSGAADEGKPTAPATPEAA